jgi:hypothetical protein
MKRAWASTACPTTSKRRSKSRPAKISTWGSTSTGTRERSLTPSNASRGTCPVRFLVWIDRAPNLFSLNRDRTRVVSFFSYFLHTLLAHKQAALPPRTGPLLLAGRMPLPLQAPRQLPGPPGVRRSRRPWCSRSGTQSTTASTPSSAAALLGGAPRHPPIKREKQLNVCDVVFWGEGRKECNLTEAGSFIRMAATIIEEEPQQYQ